MKYATYSITNNDYRSTTRSIKKTGGWWVRFGDDLLAYAANDKWSDVDARFSKGQRNTGQQTGTVRKGNMHLVVQKGRTFQNEHPDAKVILDKGRYLVVDMAPSKAKKLNKPDEVCFTIQPLAENQVVYERHSAARSDQPTDRTHASLVSLVQKPVFEAYISHLVSYPTRLSTGPEYMQAATWCEGVLSGLGLSTSLHEVPMPGGRTSANVVATLQGTQPVGRDNVIVVAHLDSVNHPGGPSANAPGADDNASGSAGVLTLAAACAAHRFAQDITFILFGGEEQGLHGSRQYVAAMSPAERARTRAVLNMDMIGSVNTPPPTVLLEGSPVSQSQIDGLAAAAAQFTSLTVETSLDYFNSDHEPFLDEGIPAVLTIEGADSSNSAVHTGDDTLDRIDMDFATSILQMNAGFLAAQAEIAATEEQPKPDCGCGCSGASSGDPAHHQMVREVSFHYQALFAQYARLGRDGSLSAADYGNWQAARAVHDALVGQTAGTTPVAPAPAH